jgi:1-acyl-sn-glycerol-3-phosphate acyltransferase
MLKRAYFICAYFASWIMFGAVGLGLNAACAALLLLPDRPWRGSAARRAIRSLFVRWTAWLRAARLVTVAWSGDEAGLAAGPAVWVANHPGLLDATFLLAQMPEAICIFKPALLRNPFVAPAALLAGYASGDAGVDAIRDLAARIAAGCSVLVFPEGTRTRAGAALNPLKPGFAFIAKRAAAPVRVLTIEAPGDLLPRGRPWWRVPRFPSRVVIHVDRLIPYDPESTAAEIVAEVERRFRVRRCGAA